MDYAAAAVTQQRFLLIGSICTNVVHRILFGGGMCSRGKWINTSVYTAWKMERNEQDYAGDHTQYSHRPSHKDGGKLAGGQRVSTPQSSRLTV